MHGSVKLTTICLNKKSDLQLQYIVQYCTVHCFVLKRDKNGQNCSVRPTVDCVIQVCAYISF